MIPGLIIDTTIAIILCVTTFMESASAKKLGIPIKTIKTEFEMSIIASINFIILNELLLATFYHSTFSIFFILCIALCTFNLGFAAQQTQNRVENK